MKKHQQHTKGSTKMTYIDCLNPLDLCFDREKTMKS